jgi:hypothetical protein
MSLSSWIFWVVASVIPIVGLMFGFFKYLNPRGSSKKKVLVKSLIAGVGISLVIFFIGLWAVVKTDQLHKGTNQPDLLPYIELSREYPIPEEFPPSGEPLTHPVTELYLWRNIGGPIYHCEAQVIDIIEASVGPCGKPKDFKSRIIPITNSGHYKSPIMNGQAEMPFYVSIKHKRYLTFFDKAIYGLQIDEKDDALKPYAERYKKILNSQKDRCGGLLRREIIIKFTFVDVHNEKKSLYYRLGPVYPYETLLEEQWLSIMDQISDSERKEGYYLNDISDPNNILNFIDGKNLLKK